MKKSHPIANNTWGEEELNAIQEVINSGRFTCGDKVKEFEEEFALRTGTKYAVMCNSGSSANLLMVAATSIRQGVGTVIVPAISWATSYAPFQQYGWNLKFVDIDRETLNYDIEQLHEAYTGEELILSVNLLGNPNDYSRFPVLGNGILEDNCESMGAKYGTIPTGNFGSMGSHSMYFSHHICTMEGGVITTDDMEYRDLLLSLRSHGWTRHQGDTGYNFIYPGYNLRPIEFQGAIGIEQLKKLKGFVEARRKNAENYPLKTQVETQNGDFKGESSWYGFSIISENIQEIKDYFDSIGVEWRPILSHFTRSEAIKYFNYEIHGELKNADYVYDNGIYIGNSHEPIDWSFLDHELFNELKK
jgi:CDP-6-deoxy-D-xylo-4-hexulose-3-dehydrase